MTSALTGAFHVRRENQPRVAVTLVKGRARVRVLALTDRREETLHDLVVRSLPGATIPEEIVEGFGRGEQALQHLDRDFEPPQHGDHQQVFDLGRGFRDVRENRQPPAAAVGVAFMDCRAVGSALGPV